MAGYPYYPYSVILNVEDNKYATGALPNLSVYKKDQRETAIKQLIKKSINTLQIIANSQKELYTQAQQENPDLVKKILEGRSITINDSGEKETLIQILDQIDTIDNNTFLQMEQYKKTMDNFMKELNKKISNKILTPKLLEELLQEVTENNASFRGIAEQTRLALQQAPLEVIKLFKQIPKEKLDFKNKKGISAFQLFQSMINGSVKTLNEVKKILENDIITRETFFTKLAEEISLTHQENDYVAVDQLDKKEIEILLWQKYLTNPDSLFDNNISLEIKTPSVHRQQKAHKKKKRGSDLIELSASFGGQSLLTEDEITRHSIKASHTGGSTLRKTMTLTVENTDTKVDRKKYKDTFQALINDIQKGKTVATIKYKTSFRDDKPDDIISFITDSGTQYNFQFSDKLIQKDPSERTGRGGLGDISLEGGTLYSTIQLLNNYYPQFNEEHLIFTLLNLANASSLSKVLDEDITKNFIKMILVSYVYLYAFNPQAEQIHNELARITQLEGNTVYFHHVDTEIVPSYKLLYQTIKQLESMLENIDVLQETDQFIKVLIEPSESFGGYETQLLDFAYSQQENPWKTVADIIAKDTVIDIALNLFALGY